MATHTERFLVDEEGHRLGVVLDTAEYQEILEDLEELESIRAYDAAKASDEEGDPFRAGITVTVLHAGNRRDVYR